MGNYKLHRVLRAPGRRRGAGGRADRLRVRARDLRLPRDHDAHAAHGGGQPHGRGDDPHHPAVGAAVRVPRPADRDDRHGAGDGGFPGEPARPRARRPLLRAARRDVSRLRHFRLEGGRHGGGRAGAVSRDEAARRQARRSGGAAVVVRRDVGDDPAEPGADHHRFGHRRVDRGTVHRRAAAGAGAGARAVRGRVVALPQRRPLRRAARQQARDRSRPSSSRCPASRCRS